MSLEKGIYDRIRTDAGAIAIVPAASMFGARPKNDVGYPRVTFFEVFDTPDSGGAFDSEFQIDCWAKTRAVVKSFNARMWALLDQQPLTGTPERRVDVVQVLDSRVSYDPDEDVFQGITRVRIRSYPA